MNTLLRVQMHGWLMVKFFIVFLVLKLSLIAELFADELYLGRWKTQASSVIREKKEGLRIGILTALEWEGIGLQAEMQEGAKKIDKGLRTYYKGNLWGFETVHVTSHEGKVAAASAATELISFFEVDCLIVIGIAGGIKTLGMGDVVIANGLVQYDMHAHFPIPPFVIPQICVKTFVPDALLQKLAKQGTEIFFAEYAHQLKEKGIENPRSLLGLVGTADNFVQNPLSFEELKIKLPHLTCVEMEGAAVAQVCYENDVPCLVVRMISDHAGYHAHRMDTPFKLRLSSFYSSHILKNIYSEIQKLIN